LPHICSNHDFYSIEEEKEEEERSFYSRDLAEEEKAPVYD
jgi:hypothetical protein